jgi:hypothetical protein
VRVWNLGRLPAYGVRLRVYWANPSFSFNDPSGPGSPHYISGTYINLSSRYQPDSHIVVRLPALWVPVVENQGHECLLAKVDCFADRTGPGFDAGIDRHVGQKNLFLADPQEDLGPLFDSLGLSLDVKAGVRLLFMVNKKPKVIFIESSSIEHGAALSKVISSELDISDISAKTLFSRLNTTNLEVQAVKGRNIMGGYTILTKL